MRAVLAGWLVLLGACAASGAGRKPLAVLYESEPWSMGDVAACSPVFALYDDGLAIYLVQPGDPAPRYASVTLSEGERRRLLSSLSPDLEGLEESYDLFEWPHHPFNVLHFWRKGRRKTIMVYGDLRQDAEVRGKCPAAFVAAFDALRGFQDDRAVPWRPEKLQLHFSEQELLSSCRAWPAGWPDLSHPDTRKVDGGYLLYLDFAHLDSLTTLREHPGNSHADVEIGGRRGSVAYSYPFPCHEAWEAH